jgi:hypothetical protein
MPAGAAPVEGEVPVGDRVLHNGGRPAFIRPGHPEDVVARNQPRTQHEALGELDRRVARVQESPVTEQRPELPEQGSGDGGTVIPGEMGEGAEPGQGRATPETEGQPGTPAAGSETVDVRALLEERDRQHQAEMAMLRDDFQRTLDRVTQIAGAQRPASPAEPPEDVDPDVTPSKVYGPALQRQAAEIAQIRSQLETDRIQRNARMVDDHLRGLAEKSPVFKGRPQLTGQYVESIREGLMTDQNVRTGNWQSEAQKRLKDVETRLAAELPPVTTPAGRKAAEAAGALAASRKSVPLGAGSSTPQPGVPQPKINWRDPDERKKYGLQMLDEIEAGRA